MRQLTTATEAANNYIKTMEFVREETKDYNTVHESTIATDKQDAQVKRAGMKDIQLPLSSDTWATLSAPFPMDENSWNQMLIVLNAMKPALISKVTQDVIPVERKDDEG